MSEVVLELVEAGEGFDKFGDGSGVILSTGEGVILVNAVSGRNNQYVISIRHPIPIFISLLTLVPRSLGGYAYIQSQLF